MFHKYDSALVPLSEEREPSQATMKQTVPFLPRLKMTRHLSTIVEVRDEDVEEFNNADGTILFRRGENRRWRLNRRVNSCNDITEARELIERNRETCTLPPLPNTKTVQRKALHGNRTSGPKDNLNSLDRTDNIFPDFRPSDRNCSIIDFDTKVGRHSTRLKSNAEIEGGFSHNKENIVASWLQFFG